MATITSLGAGSGLELESLVTKLMAAESIPLKTLQTKQSSYETKISAFGSLSSKLSDLQSAASGMTTDTLGKAADKFATFTATVGNTSVGTATATSGATSGSYSLEVSQLAVAEKQKSSAVASGTTSIASSASSLTLTYAGTDHTIDLAAGGSLNDLRDAINKANTGVSATIVTGSDGAHLVLTGETGEDNTISLDTSSLSSPLTFSQIQGAKDAKLTLDGISITSASNTVTDALDGVTLQLSATTTSATTLTVNSDLTDKITSALNAFVTAYNSASTSMKSLGAYDQETGTAGTLQGNGTLRTVQSQLRSLLTTTTSGNSSSTYQILSNIGVSVTSSGTLSLDATKLAAALAADPDTVSNLVSNVGKAFDKSINNMVGTTGSIGVATTSLNNIVSDLEDRQTSLQKRLDSIEARYRSQFSALDSLVASLTSTSDYISTYLTNINSSSK